MPGLCLQGLGKTLSTLALIWTLLKQGPTGSPTVRKVLVVVPSSLVGGWYKEVKKWFGLERMHAMVITASSSGNSKTDVLAKIHVRCVPRPPPPPPVLGGLRGADGGPLPSRAVTATCTRYETGVHGVANPAAAHHIL